MTFDIVPGKIELISEMRNLFSKRTGRHSNQLGSNIPNFPSYVAFLKDDIVGFVTSKSFAPDMLEIANIYVDKQYRGSGLGTDLLRSLEEDCAQKHNALIAVNSMLYQSNENKRSAETFYVKNGYQCIFHTENTKVFCKNLKT